MSLEDQVEAKAGFNAPSAPKLIGKSLNITLKVTEGESVAEIISKAEDLGEIDSISLSPRYDYGDGGIW